MNAQLLDRYRRQLQLLRARVRPLAASVAEQALSPSGGQGDGALSNVPFHLGDGGSEEFLHDMSAALAENEQYLMAEIGDALRRLDEGRFGGCEVCGQVISRERLDVIPYARYCIKCAAQRQSGLDVNLNTGRPRSPADTLAPEGSMEEDWRRVDEDYTSSAAARSEAASDGHAAGEPGGGGALGGLAGSNEGRGEPAVSGLQASAGSGELDRSLGRDDPPDTPRSGRAGGAVGGTPARKRSK
jgi:RNA polymerase-binding transcription factor DksA